LFFFFASHSQIAALQCENQFGIIPQLISFGGGWAVNLQCHSDLIKYSSQRRAERPT